MHFPFHIQSHGWLHRHQGACAVYPQANREAQNRHQGARIIYPQATWGARDRYWGAWADYPKASWGAWSPRRHSTGPWASHGSCTAPTTEWATAQLQHQGPETQTNIWLPSKARKLCHYSWERPGIPVDSAFPDSSLVPFPGVSLSLQAWKQLQEPSQGPTQLVPGERVPLPVSCCQSPSVLCKPGRGPHMNFGERDLIPKFLAAGTGVRKESQRS